MPKSDDLKNRLDELFSQSQPGNPPAAEPPAAAAPPQGSPGAASGELSADRMALFEHAFAGLAIGAMITGLDGRFVQVNAAFCRLLGYEWAEIQGRSFQDFTYPEDQLVGAEARQALVDGKIQAARIEKRYVHKDGHPLWVDLNISVMPGAAGQAAYFLVFAQDISPQRRTAAQLEKRMRELSCLNDIGHKIDERPALADFFAWVCQRIPAAFQHPDVCIAAIEYDHQVYGDGRAMTQASKTVGGLRAGGDLLGWLHVAYTEPYDFGDSESALMGNLVSRLSGYIETSRLLAYSGESLKSAQDSQQMLSSAINNIPNPIFFKDANGIYTGCNQAFLEYVGKRSDQVVGKSVYEVYADPALAEQYDRTDNELLRTLHPITYEAAVRYADGTLHQAIFNKAAMRDLEGQLVGMVGTMVDITARKRAEEQALSEERALEEALRVGKMAYWEFDIATQMFTFNPQWYALFRTQPEREGDYHMSAEHFALTYVHPDSREQVGRNIGMAIQTDDPNYYYEEEAKIIFGDGSLAYILLRMQVQKDEQGRTVKLYGTNQDITDRKLSELLIQRRAAELATVAQVSTAIASELDPQKLLQSVVDLTKENFGLYHAHIYLLDADQDELALAAGAGEVGRQMVAQGWKIPLERERSLVVQAARTRQGVTVNDVTQEPDFLPNPLLPHTRAELAVPLVAGGQVLGVLDVQSAQAGVFQDEDLRIQMTLAAQVAVALENARRYAERKQVEETLATNEARFRSLVSNVPGAIYRCWMDENWTMQYLSEPIERLTGYPVSDFINNQVRAYGDVIHPEDSDLVTNTIVSAVEASEPWVVEYRIVRADGEVVWVYEAGRAVKDEAGNVQWLDGGIFDINDRKQAEQKALEEERALEEALRMGKMARWEFDMATQMFTFNPQWYALFRTQPEREGDYHMSAGHFELTYVHPDSREQVRRNIGMAIQTDDPNYYYEEEAKIIFGDGSLGYILLRMQVQKDEQGRTVKLYGTNQDITDFKQASLLIQRRAAELATVAQVSTAIASELDPQKLLQSVVDLTKENFGLYHAHIYLLDADQDELALTAGAGEVGRQMVAQGWKIPLERERSLVVQAARTRQGVTVNDVTQEPDFLPNPLLPHTRAELAVPLVAGERVLGVLDVQSAQAGAFQDEDLRIQMTLAAQVTVALENARQYEQTRNSEQLVRSIIDATPDWVFVKDLNHRFILVNQSFAQSMRKPVEAFYGKDDLEMGFARASVMGDETLGVPGYWWDDQKVLDTGQPLTITSEQNEVDGEQRYFDVYKAPLRDLYGTTIGLLGYARDVTERERLLLEAERQAQVMAILNEMGRVLSGNLDTDRVLNTIHAYTNRLMDASNFFVAMYDEKMEQLSFPLAYSSGKPVELAPRPRGKGLTDYVLTSRQPLLLSDHVLDGMRALGCDVLTYGDNDVAQSWLGVPLIYRERILGAIAVQSTKIPGLYLERHRELLMAVAAQAANTIILAEQFHETERALSETREYAGQVGALNDFAARMSVAEDETQIYEIAGSFIYQIPAFNLTSLAILEEPGDFLRLVMISAADTTAAPAARRIPTAVSASGKAILEQRLMAWPEEGSIEAYLEGQQLRELGVQGIMAAPLMVGGKAVGTLNVASREREHFEEREKNLLRQVAALAGAAIENRRLLEQVRKRASQEQRLREISEHVRSSMDADIILRTTVRELGNILGRKTFIRLGSETELSPYLGETPPAGQPHTNGGNGNRNGNGPEAA